MRKSNHPQNERERLRKKEALFLVVWIIACFTMMVIYQKMS
ncbi:hypothetical protein [Limosilactobacillus frumenti]|nr:hypothetical protein [Limosilactobacillus frumenti]